MKLDYSVNYVFHVRHILVSVPCTAGLQGMKL